MGLLDDKVILIAGASRGIGAAAARLFAGEGARLVLDARSEGALQAFARQLREDGTDVAVDVRTREDSERLVDAAIQRHGRLDWAFNNAAAGIRRPASSPASTRPSGTTCSHEPALSRCVRRSRLWWPLAADRSC